MSQARPLHPRAFLVAVLWTLLLLLLGSIVHATGSSLACPDWPTCYGTMLPEMEGGVFWEHLHRLVAGGLVLLFLLAAYLAHREEDVPRWVRRGTWAGVLLLLVQAVLGGVTVLLRLPDAVSTAHLVLAFSFLALATVLATRTAAGWEGRGAAIRAGERVRIRLAAVSAGVLVLLQSLLGAVVRHTDAGVACPDVPRCLGEWIPPLGHPLVALHFGHRVLGLLTLVAVLWAGHRAFHGSRSGGMRSLAIFVALAGAAQVLLGFLSVYTGLAVVPVSLHTLVAASLVAALTALATLTWAPESGSVPGEIT